MLRLYSIRPPSAMRLALQAPSAMRIGHRVGLRGRRARPLRDTGAGPRPAGEAVLRGDLSAAGDSGREGVGEVVRDRALLQRADGGGPDQLRGPLLHRQQAGGGPLLRAGVAGPLADREPPARQLLKQSLVRRLIRPLPSPRRPYWRWPHGVTSAVAKEAIHAVRRSHLRAPPPIARPSPTPPAGIWPQLPPARRQRLQRLLAELLSRPVLAEAAPPREGCHDRPRA